MNQKLFIVGLDGATWTVLNLLMDRGAMPFLREFLNEGSSGILMSTEPPITPTAWTSFMTGLSPEIHGVYGFKTLATKDSKLSLELNSSSDIRQRNIWQVLSNHQRRVCILNLPLTYPPYEVNGILVSGFPCPTGRESAYTHPSGLKKEILNVIPNYQPSTWDNSIDGVAQGVEYFVDRMIHLAQMRALLSAHFLNDSEWDVFMVHFQETDFLQHRFWHCLEPGHPWFSEDDFKTCARFYRFIDEALSTLCGLASNHGHSILLMSDHGFQRCNYVVKINNWLVAERYLRLHDDLRQKGVGLLKRLVRSIPLQYRMKLAASKNNNELSNRYLSSVIDYSRSVVYVETNSTHIAYAHFLTGRPELRERFVRDLSLLSIPEAGRVVSEISPVDGRPDVMKIAFNKGMVAAGLLGSYEPWYSGIVLGRSTQIGVHHREGVIMADSSLGHLPLPADICGLFDYILGHQEISEPYPGNSERAASETLSEAERNQIEESLKGLGYL